MPIVDNDNRVLNWASSLDPNLNEQMEGKTWLQGRGMALVDEIPSSYKDVHQVIHDSADLVEVKVELVQILNYKGT